MLDILDFQEDKGGDLRKLRESQQRRYAPEAVVDDVVALFEDMKKTRYAATQIGTQINVMHKEIGAKKKVKAHAKELQQKKATLEKEKKVLDDSAAEKDAILQRKVGSIGNYVHESVPVDNNKGQNPRLRDWAPKGVKVEKRDCLSHQEVLTRIDGYDPERGLKIVDHQGYYLTGYGLFLNLALVNYGLEFLWKKGYKPNQLPHFMLREYMTKKAHLEQFDEELYKVTDDGEKHTDKYLIARAEQPLSAIHEGEWLQGKDLPIKYAGFSTCYRKEAGAHGKDARGVFRAQQFEKVEQFILTQPENSWQVFDEMIAISEEFYQTLGLPYQVVSIVSGALNKAAAKKYDLEAWFPFQGEYTRLVSCSNCTDYQSRALNIRYGAKGLTDTRKKYVHTLKSTLCATTWALCCILENYQTETGVRVPEVLRKYIPGAPQFIAYSRELPMGSASQKSKSEGGGSKTKLRQEGDMMGKMEELKV